MVWAVLHWYMMHVRQATAARPAVLRCVVCQTAWGMCAEGLKGPRHAQGIQTKMLKCFHDLYLLSRGAGQDIYTSFANFEGVGTDRPAIPSLIPILGGKERPILMAHLTSASTTTTKDNSPRFIPTKPNFPRKHHWHECAQQLL